MTREPNKGSQEKQKIALNCLQGKAATDDLLRRWRRYVELPPRAHAKIWEILNPILLGLPPESTPQHIAQHAAMLNVEVDDLTLALEACHALLVEATARDISSADFNSDLAALSGDLDTGVARASLIEGYERSKTLVRQRLVSESVADHGKVLTGLNWRIDRILMSNKGFNLNTPILLMTLHYEDAGEKHHVTLQVSDSVIKMLRSFTEQMLSLGSSAPSEDELQSTAKEAPEAPPQSGDDS